LIKFEKNYNRLFLKYVRKAIDDYNMISPEDKIVVAVSGGKDSIFLLFCLKLIQLTALKDIEIVAIHVDLGLDMNLEPLKYFYKKNSIKLIIEKTTREEMKNLMFNLETIYPEYIDRLMTSLCNVNMKNLWKQRNNHF